MDSGVSLAFDTGPQFAFNFGPGVRVHQFGGGRPRGRPRPAGPNGQQAQEGSLMSTLLGLLPILFLFIFPLLNSIFSSPAQPATPTIVFDIAQPPYTLERVIPDYGVKYFVNPDDVTSFTNSRLQRLDQQAGNVLIKLLSNECDNERARQQRMLEDAQGWFFQDPDKMEAARKYDMPNCKRLRET